MSTATIAPEVCAESEGERVKVKVGMRVEAGLSAECGNWHYGAVVELTKYGAVIKTDTDESDEFPIFLAPFDKIKIIAAEPDDETDAVVINAKSERMLVWKIDREMNLKLSRLEVYIEDWCEQLEKLEDMLAASVETILHYDTGSGDKASSITECELTALDYAMVTVRQRLVRMRESMMESTPEKNSPDATCESNTEAIKDVGENVPETEAQDNDDDEPIDHDAANRVLGQMVRLFAVTPPAFNKRFLERLEAGIKQGRPDDIVSDDTLDAEGVDHASDTR